VCKGARSVQCDAGVGFGRPAADAVVGQVGRLRTARALAVAGGTLNRETPEIKNQIRKMTPRVPRYPRKIDRLGQMRGILLLAA